MIGYVRKSGEGYYTSTDTKSGWDTYDTNLYNAHVYDKPPVGLKREHETIKIVKANIHEIDPENCYFPACKNDFEECLRCKIKKENT